MSAGGRPRPEDRLFGSPQLGLFGVAEQRARPADDPALQALAAKLPPSLRLGTSSWTFPAWVGLVYAERYRNKASFTRESLREYAAHPLFRTVGIDRSFYNPLSAGELEHYAELLQGEPDFRAMMKVWKDVAARKIDGRFNPNFLDVGLFREAVLDPALRHFREHLGPLVIEVSPDRGPVNAAGFAARLAGFLAQVPTDEVSLAFELRDERLLSRAYLETLAEHDAAHVFNYWSAMPQLAAQLRWVRGTLGQLPGRHQVARLMIPPGLRYADLKEAFDPFDRLHAVQPTMRADVLALIEAALAEGKEVTVIANNKAEGCSPLTIRAIADAWCAR